MLPLGEMVKCMQDFPVFLTAACDSTEAAMKLHNHHMMQNFTFTYTPWLISARAILPSASPCFPVMCESSHWQSLSQNLESEGFWDMPR